MIKVSIVIPTYNKLSRLKACLKALEEQMTPEVQVVVVFDGCKEEVVEGFKKLKFSYEPTAVICKKNVGRAAARNRGISAAKGKIVIFMDDDRIPDKNFIKGHMEAHKDRKCVILGKRREIEVSDEEIEDLYLHPEMLEKYKSQSSDEVVRNFIKVTPYGALRWLGFYTGNVSVEREDLESVNGFDENIVKWGYEDTELGIRLEQEKIPFYIADHVVSYHMLHESNYVNKAKESAEALRYMTRKYRKNPFFWCLIIMIRIYISIRGTGTAREKKVQKS